GGAVVAALALIVIGTGLVVRLLLSDLSAIGDYVASLAENHEAPRLDPVFSDMFAPLLLTIRRHARSGAAKRQSESLRDETSGLDYLPDPVLMLDSDRRVMRDNAAARDLFGPGLIGRDFAAVLRNPAVLSALESVTGGDELIVDIEFLFRDPVERQFRARVARVTASDARPVAFVIALQDITAIKRAESMRSDFVTNASHELQTPISVLLGCVQTLQGPARDDPKAQVEFIDMMEGQATRMARLVDDLLSLSRIELYEHVAPLDNVDLRQIVKEVVSALDQKAQDRGIRVELDFADDLSNVPGDKDDIYRTLQNLLENALKYGAENSTVTVAIEFATEDQLAQLPREFRYVAVSVRDQGDGIAPEHLPRLTERFYRVDADRSRKLGGTGLGLAIVKQMVNRHRGVLLIESVMGEGSTFTIVLPARTEPSDMQISDSAANAGRKVPEQD
ncbi:MAG: PAS domain-containing protein, partial [Rhodospirillales bacterium]|nr:PAS domain-containing protein [Rhodospirillales bacterium]